MRISPYLCHVVGESPAEANRLHDSSIKRLQSYASPP